LRKNSYIILFVVRCTDPMKKTLIIALDDETVAKLCCILNETSGLIMLTYVYFFLDCLTMLCAIGRSLSTDLHDRPIVLRYQPIVLRIWRIRR